MKKFTNFFKKLMNFFKKVINFFKKLVTLSKLQNYVKEVIFYTTFFRCALLPGFFVGKLRQKVGNPTAKAFAACWVYSYYWLIELRADHDTQKLWIMGLELKILKKSIWVPLRARFLIPIRVRHRAFGVPHSYAYIKIWGTSSKLQNYIKEW